MKNKIKEEVSVMQAGFLAGRGTRDHFLNLKNIMEIIVASVSLLC